MRKGHFCLLLLATAIITAWAVEKQKKKVRTNLILIRNTEINKVLIMVCPLKPQGFSGAMTEEKHCFFDTVFSQILKIDQQRFIYVDP